MIYCYIHRLIHLSAIVRRHFLAAGGDEHEDPQLDKAQRIRDYQMLSHKRNIYTIGPAVKDQAHWGRWEERM